MNLQHARDAIAAADTPWLGNMAAACAAFGLTPNEYWSLSIAEWEALVFGFEARQKACAVSANETLDRNALDGLMRQFPDRV